MRFKTYGKTVLVSIIICCREDIWKLDPDVWVKDTNAYYNIHVTEKKILKYAHCCKATLQQAMSILAANGILAIRRDGRANAYDILLPLQDIETLYHNEAASRCIFSC